LHVRSVLLVMVLTSAVAQAAPPPEPPSAWIGVFRPNPPGISPCGDCAKPTIVGAAGEVIVLSPGDGAPLPDSGDVTVVQPLTGMNVVAHVTHHGRVPVELFAADRRDGADAVLVLPADAHVVFVAPNARDVAAIRAALMKDEVLSGVRRALTGLEIGGVDIDGDHRADYVITYGCNAWADGDCQSKGEFLLARHGDVWRELQ
jgi:hypothetical protein